MKHRLAADIGGTFTDLVLLDEDGTLHVHKTPSTPDDFKTGVLNGVKHITTAIGGDVNQDSLLADIEYFVHGATVVLNALIQRKLPTTALVTTRGFRDVLEIMRTNNPYMYDMQYVKPKALIPRRLRFEVTERMYAEGTIYKPLEENEIIALAKAFKTKNIESAAVLFLHSYRNPIHESRAKELLEEHCPGMFVSVSHALSQEYREFERCSTASLNAYLQPVVANYLARLEDRIAKENADAEILIVQSNGGIMSVDAAKALPVRTALSGPAAGVVAARQIADAAGFLNVIFESAVKNCLKKKIF